MESAYGKSPEFQRLVKGEHPINLARVSLEIARDATPDLDPEPYLARIDELAARVQDRCRPSFTVDQRLRQINWVLFVEEGFHGNLENYDDPRNSYMNEVLDRKTGIPITLSILYKAIARKVGMQASGLCLPAHFMLRVESGNGAIFVDTFDGGTLLDLAACEKRIAQKLGLPFILSHDHIIPSPNQKIVLRMLRNLKRIHLQSFDYPSAIPVMSRIVTLAPDEWEESRDLGMLHLHLDRPFDAISPLELAAAQCPIESETEALSALISVAKREMAGRN